MFSAAKAVLMSDAKCKRWKTSELLHWFVLPESSPKPKGTWRNASKKSESSDKVELVLLETVLLIQVNWIPNENLRSLKANWLKVETSRTCWILILQKQRIRQWHLSSWNAIRQTHTWPTRAKSNFKRKRAPERYSKKHQEETSACSRVELTRLNH